jgi:hypothetical protein
VDTLQRWLPPARPEADAPGALFLGLLAGFSLGDYWPQLKWLLAVLLGT